MTATAAMATRLPRPTLTLLTILSIGGVFVHDESKRCIDCADSGDRRADVQRLQMLRGQSQVGSSELASAAVTPVSLHLSSEALADTPW